ncbi:MAG: hypothetical protein WC674_07315 [Candidatus Krumholzibacteriia bacterium]
MCRQTCIWFLVVVLLLPAFSCARLPEKPAQEGVTVGSEQLPALNSIPAEWGKLVSVTTNPAYPGWFQLWFEDETNTVRMATFNFRTKQLDPDAMVLPRR